MPTDATGASERGASARAIGVSHPSTSVPLFGTRLTKRSNANRYAASSR